MSNGMVAAVAEYMVNYGRKRTMSGNYHFEFNEIEDLFGVSIDGEFKESVGEHIAENYSDMVAELDMEEDFDLMFYTGCCPYAEEE